MVSEEFLKARREKNQADAERLRKHQEILLILRNESGEELLDKAFKRIETWQKKPNL